MLVFDKLILIRWSDWGRSYFWVVPYFHQIVGRIYFLEAVRLRVWLLDGCWLEDVLNSERSPADSSHVSFPNIATFLIKPAKKVSRVGHLTRCILT